MAGVVVLVAGFVQRKLKLPDQFALQRCGAVQFAAQQANQQRSSFMGGLFDLGAAGLGFATGGASLPFTSMFKSAAGGGGSPLGLSQYGIF